MPSDELRRWFGHDPTRYIAESDGNLEGGRLFPFAIPDVAVTLLYGAKNEERNKPVALKTHLERKLKQQA